jgi:hypothetical protein
MGLSIEPRLPRYNGRGEYCPLFSRLAGARILRIGTSPDCDVEGGGLAVEVQFRSGEREVVLFAFNDEGLWLAVSDKCPMD